ncbi:MAG TPA: ABC transporter ATP-binding protein [Candidatus Polarisedimenticolaceae bacterium]|nr:ABC transporter ATP-binding protein [Candidatus Polarisedimenticolaceae bacterium]
MSPGGFRRFVLWARPYRGAYLRGAAWLVATNVLALGIPWLLRGAIHDLEKGTNARRLALFALGMAGLALAQGFVRTFSRLAILGASRKIAFDVREAFYAKLLTLDARFYDSFRIGDVMSRGVNDLQLLQSFYGPGLMNALNTAVVYVGVVAVMLRIDAVLTLVALALFPLLYFGVNRMSKRVYQRSLAVQEQLASISNRAQENLAGIQQVKIYAREEQEIAAFRALASTHRDRNLAFARIRGAMVSLIGIFSGAGTLLVLFVGGLHVIHGRITLGDFVAFNAYLGQLAWPTIALGWIVNVFQRAAGAMTRLDEVLLAEPAIPPPALPAEGVIPVDGDVAIRGLTFAYPGSEDRPALEDVDLNIPKGSRVAIVGGVGSGKSTLAHLLARVYPVPAGTIAIGGDDLATTPVERVRAGIGFVPQEAFLFSRPLHENVAYGAPGASAARVDEAVALARLTGDLTALPDGLATVVGERGFTLSGGQRQRATLARAIACDPRLLILDDALSSLDAETERMVLLGLDRALAGRTLVLITHRASTLRAVDRIVVLERGRVVEDGPHAALLARGGVYARLFRRLDLEENLA